MAHTAHTYTYPVHTNLPSPTVTASACHSLVALSLAPHSHLGAASAVEAGNCGLCSGGSRLIRFTGGGGGAAAALFICCPFISLVISKQVCHLLI